MVNASKRIVSAMLSAAMLLAVLFCAPSAFGASEAEGRQTKTQVLELIDTDIWKETAGVAVISERSVAERDVISVSAEEDAERFSFFAEFEAVDLSAFSEIVISMTVKGDAESYPVTVSLGADGEVYDHKLTAAAEADVWYIPLPESIAPALDRIYISFDTREGKVSYVDITDVSADNTYSYAYLNSFSATDVSTENKIEKSAEGVRLSAENGECRADVHFVGTEGYTSDRDVLLWINVNGIRSGTIMATCRYGEQKAEGASDEKTATVDSTPRTITADGAYFFVVRGGFADVTFRFSALADGATVSLVGAGHSDMGVREETAGAVTDCRYSDGRMVVLGSLTNDASVEYYGSKLLLFAIPCRAVQDYDLEKYEPVASAGFSTKFSLSCAMDAYYKEYFYKVVLDTKEGYVPVGGTVCADSTNAAPPASSAVSALHGAEAADVFETNVSSVILDVYAGRLLEVADVYSAQTYSYVTPYYFNRQYLAELDSRIQFFKSAGVQVYLRLYSDRDGYVFDYSPDDPDSLSLMCAVGGFISERYPDIGGFIVGNALNSEVGATSPEYAEKKARLISVFSEAVRSKAPSAVVVLPFLAGASSEPQLACAMLCYYLSEYGAGSTVILYETGTYDASVVSKASYLGAIPSVFSHTSDGTAVMWKVPEGIEAQEITKAYRALCTSSTALGMRFAALSVEKASKSVEVYDSLKVMLDSENVIPATISQFFATQETEDSNLSSYGIWDFTNSYETAGWVSGGSFSAPITAKGTNGTRVLKAQSNDSSDGAGILIGKTEQSLDMTGVTARVTLTVLSSESESADVYLIFGSGESRAEYSVKVKCNELSSLLCDMSAYTGASKIDYASVIVRGVSDAQAEISKVELCSDVLTDSQLFERFSLPEKSEHDPLLYAIIIFIVAASVAIFSFLIKKQKSGRRGGSK